MKKILFLMLSLAVASSAIAGPVKHVQKGQLQPSTSRMEKLTNAPAVAYNQNVQTMNINAPKVQKHQRQGLPVEGLSWLNDYVNSSTRAVVTEQPAGNVRYYIRSGYANYCDDSSVYFGEQSGSLTVVENGDNVWFKNLFYDPEGNFDVDYWILGVKNGNEIAISLPQDVDATTYSGYTVQMAWGTTRVQSSSIKFTNSSTATAYFDIDADGVLTLRNATCSSNYAGNGLHAYVSASGTIYYQYMSLFTTTLTPAENIPDAPVIYTDADIDALDGDFVEYYRTGYSWNRDAEGYLEITEQRGMAYFFYDEDGSTVYMRDPVSGWNNGNWVKGTINGDQLSFPLNQYFYWDNSFFGLRTTYGLFELDTVTNKITYTIDPDKTDITYTISGNTITMDDCGYVDDDFTQFLGLAAYVDSAYIDRNLYCMDWFTRYYMIPGTPAIESVQPVTATTATVNWTDADANTDTWNVRYREYVDPSTVDYFFCDFEGENDVNDWWGLNLDGDNYWWQGWEAEDGNNYLGSASYINNVGALTPDNLLCTPELTLNGVVKLTAWGIDANYAAEIFKVYIFVGDTATIESINDFIAISEDVTVDGEATEYTFAIPEEYWGQQGYVAIRHYNVTDQYWLAIDDIYVGDPDGGSPWIYVNGVQALQTVLEGLTPETTYEVQVQGTNAGGVGMWTESTLFTTLADTPQPTILRGDVDGNGKVNLDDLTTLINYLVGIIGPNDIAFENAAICDSLTGDLSEDVGMDDLTALINYLVYGRWDM